MDLPEDFQMNPLSIEAEFRVLSVRRKLNELSREEVEEFLSEALLVMAKLANQLTQLREYIHKLEGKTK